MLLLHPLQFISSQYFILYETFDKWNYVTCHVIKMTYSLFRVKSNSNRESRNLVTLKWYFNLLKMFSCNIAKLRYRWRNSMKFTSYIQMIQGTVISLSCNLKNILKNFVLPAEQPVSRRCDRQWFHWRTDTSSARHTQETHPVRTAIEQHGEQTINKDAKTSGV